MKNLNSYGDSLFASLMTLATKKLIDLSIKLNIRSFRNVTMKELLCRQSY